MAVDGGSGHLGDKGCVLHRRWNFTTVKSGWEIQDLFCAVNRLSEQANLVEWCGGFCTNIVLSHRTGLFGSKELCFTQILRFHGDQICLVVTLCLHKYCTFTLLKSLWETRVMLFAQMLDFHTGHIWLADKGCDMDKHCIFTAVRSTLGDNGYVLHKYWIFTMVKIYLVVRLVCINNALSQRTSMVGRHGLYWALSLNFHSGHIWLWDVGYVLKTPDIQNSQAWKEEHGLHRHQTFDTVVWLREKERGLHRHQTFNTVKSGLPEKEHVLC